MDKTKQLLYYIQHTYLSKDHILRAWEARSVIYISTEMTSVHLCFSITFFHIYKHIQGRMQDFSGGGANFKISGILDIHAAKLRAFARGVWGHAPQENF